MMTEQEHMAQLTSTLLSALHALEAPDVCNCIRDAMRLYVEQRMAPYTHGATTNTMRQFYILANAISDAGAVFTINTTE